MINLPNKRYWLLPEHAQTTEFLNNYFAWFACAVYLILVFAFDYAVQNNLHPENPPDPARMWCVLAGFGAPTLWGTILMLATFLRPPEEL